MTLCSDLLTISLPVLDRAGREGGSGERKKKLTFLRGLVMSCRASPRHCETVSLFPPFHRSTC